MQQKINHQRAGYLVAVALTGAFVLSACGNLNAQTSK